MALLRCRACLHSAFAAAFFFFAFSSAAAGSDNSARRHFLAGRFMFCVAQSGTGQTLDCSASGVSPSAARAAGKSKFCPHFFRHRLFLCSRGFKRPASRILPKAAAELASKYEKCTDYLLKASMAGFNFSSRSYYYLRRDEVAAGPRSRPTTVSGREPGDVLGLFITPICVFIVSLCIIITP